MAFSFENPLDVCFKIVEILGACHVKDSASPRKVYIGRLIFAMTLGMACLAEGVACISISEALNHFPAFMIIGLLLVRSIHIYYNVDDIKSIKKALDALIEVSSDERFKARLHIEKRIEFIVKVLKLFVYITFLATSILACIVIFEGKIPYNFTIMDTDNSTIAFIVASLHMVATSSIGNMVLIGLNLMPVVLISYAIGILDELADRIKLIGKSDDFGQTELVKCIQIHENIIRFVSMIEKQFGMIFFFQSQTSLLVIGFFIFNLSASVDFLELSKAFVLSMMTIYEIFIPCFFGSQLHEASSKLIDEVYCSNWLALDTKTKKILVTFMENLKYPMEITYHGLFYVNLISFREIIDSAYSLFAVLQQIVH